MKILYSNTLTKFAVLVCLCVPLPDDDLVEVETYGRNINDKLLFITNCRIKY